MCTAKNLVTGTTLCRRLERLIDMASDTGRRWRLFRAIGPDNLDLAALALDKVEADARSLEFLVRRKRRAAKRLKQIIAVQNLKPRGSLTLVRAAA